MGPSRSTCTVPIQIASPRRKTRTTSSPPARATRGGTPASAVIGHRRDVRSPPARARRESHPGLPASYVSPSSSVRPTAWSVADLRGRVDRVEVRTRAPGSTRLSASLGDHFRRALHRRRPGIELERDPFARAGDDAEPDSILRHRGLDPTANERRANEGARCRRRALVRHRAATPAGAITADAMAVLSRSLRARRTRGSSRSRRSATASANADRPYTTTRRKPAQLRREAGSGP